MTTIDYYAEVVQEATQTATLAAFDILHELIMGNQTIEELIQQDIDEAMYEIFGRNSKLSEAMQDYNDEMLYEVITNFTTYLKKQLNK